MLDAPDNIVASPRGGVLLCEDGGNEALYIRGLNREGHIFDFVRQPNAVGEFAGTCFSPDGRVLFFNVQGGGGTTYAMWAPGKRDRCREPAVTRNDLRLTGLVGAVLLLAAAAGLIPDVDNARCIFPGGG